MKLVNWILDLPEVIGYFALLATLIAISSIFWCGCATEPAHPNGTNVATIVVDGHECETIKGIVKSVAFDDHNDHYVVIYFDDNRAIILRRAWKTPFMFQIGQLNVIYVEKDNDIIRKVDILEPPDKDKTTEKKLEPTRKGVL